MTRRPLIVACVCLILGALTAVAAAWGFKIYYCFVAQSFAPGSLVEGEAAWTVQSWETLGRSSYTLTPYQLSLARDIEVWARIAAEETDPDIRERAELVLSDRKALYQTSIAGLRRYGPARHVPAWVPRPWPIPPFEVGGVHRYGIPGGDEIEIIATGGYGWPLRCLAAELHVDELGAKEYRRTWLIDSPWGTPTMPIGLPLRPLWAGMAVDTASFSALWGALLWGRPALRRWRRRRKGMCPMCAYDLRGELEKGCSECGWGRDA